VDAYDGTVTLYQWDGKDPMLKAWMNVFPGLVKPGDHGSQMPQSVREHVRYPQDLFDVQRGLLAQYHISDPRASYSGKGKWAVPNDPFSNAGADQPPYYVLANAADGATDGPQFQLTTPMIVPGGANNLSAYMSVDSDYGPNYGTITVLQVPTQNNIQGPSQVANVFKSNPTISKDISLLSTGQSEVLHGNLLTLPLGDSFLYVEPLYVQATSGSSSYPTLQRVLVTFGDKIGYGATLEAALTDIHDNLDPGASLVLGQTTGNGGTGKPNPPSTTPSTTPTGSGTPPSSSNTTPPASVPTNLPSIIAQIQNLQSQQASLSQQQQRLLEQLTKLLSSSTTSPSPSK